MLIPFAGQALAQVASYDASTSFDCLGDAAPEKDGVRFFGDTEHQGDRAADGGALGAAWLEPTFVMPDHPVLHATFEVDMGRDAAKGGGLVFVLHGAGPGVIGGPGQGLGYEGIAPSVAIEFHLASSGADGPDEGHVGLDLDGSMESEVVQTALPFALIGDGHFHVWVDVVDGLLTVSGGIHPELAAARVLFSSEVALGGAWGETWVGFTGTADDGTESSHVKKLSFVVDDGIPNVDDTAVDGPSDAEDGVASVAELPPASFPCGCRHGGIGSLGAGVALLGLVTRRRLRT